jgi:hypothetical protein
MQRKVRCHRMGVEIDIFRAETLDFQVQGITLKAVSKGRVAVPSFGFRGFASAPGFRVRDLL